MQNTTESPVAALQETAVERLNWTGEFTNSFIDALSEEQLTARAGGKGNHALWVIGHIANSNDSIVSMMTDEPRQLPDHYEDLFAGGTQSSDDRSVYPSIDELRQAIRQSRQRLIDWVKSLDESTAFAPTPESLHVLAPNAITLPFTLVAHEWFHFGQVASVRASLGLPPVHG